MAFIEELRQRKVVRVAVAYLVVAWLGVQVASIALPAFEAPGWVLRVLILVLALGFPLSLMLTWAVDLTPEGPRYTPGGAGFKRLAAISAALGALALGWYFFGQPAWREAKPSAPPDTAVASATAASAEPTAPKASARSIAVLPFVNMSRDPANDYFSDGLAETTLDMLAQVHDLKVIARTSSFAFKGKNSDVREIGRALDAAHLLEGSVQQAGETVRITAQLIRTQDGVHLWSGKYDRKMTDVFAIQDEIAGEVVKALQLALPAAEHQRLTGKRTENLAAYQEYLRGNALLPGRRVPDMRRALQHFERAIELDPQYAGAYAAASITLTLLDNFAGGSKEQLLKRDRYLDEALRLNPRLGEAHAVLAGRKERAGDVAGAEASYARAIDLAPNFATAYQWYGEFLQGSLGEFERALPMFQRALELDPLSPMVRNEYSFAQAANGRLDEALETNAQLLREHPDFAAGFATRAAFLEVRGDLVGALQAWKALAASDPAAVNRQLGRCNTLMRFGASDAGRACVATLSAQADADEVLAYRIAFLLDDGKAEAAWQLSKQRSRPNRWEQLQLQMETGRADEAVANLRELMPELFLRPEPKLLSNYPGDAVLGGMALVASGATEQGRDLLRRALAKNADRPHVALLYGRGWTDALAWSALGEPEKACAALREASDAGYFMDLGRIDYSPQMAMVRKKPCYEAALAVARARTAAQIDAARQAGLL